MFQKTNELSDSQINEAGRMNDRITEAGQQNEGGEIETFVPPKGKPRKRPIASPSEREEEAYSILKRACQRDSCSTYGEHVGNELRALNPTARTMAKHLINNILFDAAMGKLDSENLSIAEVYLSPSLNSNSSIQSTVPVHTAVSADPATDCTTSTDISELLIVN